VVPEEVLSEFCAGRGETFLAATRLMNKFEHISLAEGAGNSWSSTHFCNQPWSEQCESFEATEDC
jgi:hypothetical protein